MKKYISIMLITLAVAGSSCKKTYLSELAVNPNKAASTTAGLQLSAALSQTANLTSGSTNARYLCWDNYYSWSTNYQASTALLLYSITTSSYDSYTPLFANISNYNAILTATSEPYYNAIAHIMMVYDFQQLVDQYGNVPYTQALQGITQLSPKYDDASGIYDDLLVQLDAAIKLIQNAPASAATPSKYDILFGATSAATMTKWIQFANSLKLRIAIRQSGNGTVAGNGQGTTWATKSAKLITSIQATAALGYLGSLTTNLEAAVNPGYNNTDPYQPPLDLGYGYKASGSFAGVGAQYQANTYAVNYFVGTGTQAAPNDPRLQQIYANSATASVNTTIIATKLGETAQPTFGGKVVKPSVFSAFMLNPARNSPIMSASETLFLQAEAVKIGLLTTGTEVAFYNAGVTASFVEDGLTAAQATTYLTAYPYPVAGTPAQREQAIITQKWAALDPYEPLESYCEILRTGYPAVPLSILPGVTATTYVARMLYPQTEYNTNASNVNAQGTITSYSPKIFWAQ